MLIVNNTRADLRNFYGAINASINVLGRLPEELADLFSLKFVIVDGETRAIINDAEESA